MDTMRFAGSLSTRFSLMALLGGQVFGLLVAFFLITVDYQRHVQDTRMTMDDFIQQSVLPLSKLIGADAQQNALLLVEGMVNGPWIQRASVMTPEGRVLLSREKAESASLPWWMPAPFSDPLRTVLPGALPGGKTLLLEVAVDQGRLMAPAIERAEIILQSCLVAGLLAPLLVLALMRSMVTDYLRRIIHTLNAINPAKLDAVRLPVHPAHRYDELGALERVGNRLLREMHDLMESRKTMAEALFDSERRMRQLMDAIPHSIFARDHNGRFVYANRCYAMTIGKTVEAIEGRTLSELMPALSAEDIADRLAADRRIIHSKEEEIIPEEVVLDAYGVRRVYQTIRVPLQYPDRTIALAVSMDITDQKVAEERMRFMAFHDALTSLPNRSQLMESMDRELARSHRSGQIGALLFVDLDGFKAVNDRMGHQCGDMLLQQLSRRLEEHVREGDLASRLAGDEFVILTPDLGPDHEQAFHSASRIAEHLRQVLALPFSIANESIKLTASIGVVLFPDGRSDSHALISRADSAMYRAKIEGKNAVVFFGDEEAAAGRRLTHLREDLPFALERNELMLLFVPQVDVQGRVTGGEMLLRWQHPEEGIILPKTFLPLMESSGLILQVGDWVLDQGCQCLSSWRVRGLWRDTMALSMNVSARELLRSHLADHLYERLEVYSVPASCLMLEVHEGALLNYGDSLLGAMQSLRTAGFRLALDDFGAGYFSLNDLGRLPIDCLKAAPSLISHPNGERPRALFRGLISLSQQLGIDVVAEGVEHRAQLDFLEAVDCRQCQGYYFGVPMQLADFEMLLAQGRVPMHHGSVG
ncbi:MAG TPA: EAL domain-containing protein [Pseudomonadales bacterium]